MLKTSIILTVFFTLLLQANENSKASIDQIASKNAFNTWQGKIDSATVRSGFFVDLSFLYLKAEVDGVTVGQKLDVTPDFTASPNISIKDTPQEMDFQWNPGLIAGIGYTFAGKEQWQLGGYWTYYHSNANKQSSIGSETGEDFISPGWLPFLLGPNANSVKANWSMNFNLMDIALSRNAFFGKWLSLDPQVGVRAAWINQDYNAKYNGGFSFLNNNTGATEVIFRKTSFEADQDFCAAGLRMGSGIDWYLFSNFSISGSFFASLLYGKFDIREKHDGGFLVDFGAGPQILPITFDIDKTIHALCPVLETEIGLQWFRFFQNRQRRLLIGLFYQFDIWIDQSRLVNNFIVRPQTLVGAAAVSDDTLIADVHATGNLQLQGLRAEIRLDF